MERVIARYVKKGNADLSEFRRKCKRISAPSDRRPGCNFSRRGAKFVRFWANGRFWEHSLEARSQHELVSYAGRD